MKIVILGSGLMGRGIAFDLIKNSDFKDITIVDNYKNNLEETKLLLSDSKINYLLANINQEKTIKEIFKENDIAVSAVPYTYNLRLTENAVKYRTHFLDLGGNNEIVQSQKKLKEKAKEKKITIIPDCGLAPGLVSIITKEIVEELSNINYVKIRVGGLPLEPKPPLNYQLVFSPNGLINEYVEDAIVLDNGNITNKKSLTEIEEIIFPQPFGKMEAFITSGGCSTLPYSYIDKIKYLDYKTIRYPGHCDYFKDLLNIGPRDKLISYLKKNIPRNGKDVVLLKVFSKGKKDDLDINIDYTMIDYFDDKNNISSMMRTTSYPTSIIAQFIQKEIINKKGVFCPEEIIPCDLFFNELKKRGIMLSKEYK